eukprot:jgi/Bigna1/139166/aug1.49_g13874
MNHWYIDRTQNENITGNYGVSIGNGRVLDAEHHVLSHGRYINDAAAGIGWIMTKGNNAEMVMTTSEDNIPEIDDEYYDHTMGVWHKSNSYRSKQITNDIFGDHGNEEEEMQQRRVGGHLNGGPERGDEGNTTTTTNYLPATTTA